jgi:hypothetical protein
MYRIKSQAILLNPIISTTQYIEIDNDTFISNISKESIILIDSELIFYTSIRNRKLYNIKRGANGTNSTNHNVGSIVYLVEWYKSSFTVDPSLLQFDISVLDRNALESNIESFINVPIVLSKPSPLKAPVIINYKTLDVTAYSDISNEVINGDKEPDYEYINSSITFNYLENKKYIAVKKLPNIQIVDDDNKNFKLELIDSNYGNIIKSQAIITLKDYVVYGVPGGTTEIEIDAILSYLNLNETFELDTSYLSSVGCVAAYDQNKIVIVPSALYAGVNFKVVNSSGLVEYGFINCISDLTEEVALIYQYTSDAVSKLTTYSPPSQQEIFNTWDRFDSGIVFPNGDGATGSARRWEFLRNPDRVVQPSNSSTPTGFMSTELFDTYVFESILTSSDNDNDMIGLIICANVDNGLKWLSACRSGGGVNGGRSDMNIPSGWNWGVVTYGQEFIDGYTPKGLLIGSNGSWSNRKTKVKVIRNKNSFELYCTDWFTGTTAPPYLPESKITIDLTSNSLLNTTFNKPCKYGYLSYSQPDTTFLSTSFSGGLNTNTIYDAEENSVYDFSISTNTWIKSQDTIQDRIGYIKRVTNPETNKSFIVYEDRIEVIS